jgi:CRISPR-associated protein (TIGR02584 family)
MQTPASKPYASPAEACPVIPDSTYRVLLCVSGMSPAIITETLYALITRKQPWYPHEIHIVTTTEGISKIKKELLQPSGPLEQLLNEYWPTEQPKPRFDETTIHVISGLADVNSEESNKLAGDCIFQTYYGIQKGSLIQPDQRQRPVQIHASIAGGRKTMSFLMGHVFSLLAGPQDELSHVLVNAPFEAVTPPFFFPPKQPAMHRYTQRAEYQAGGGAKTTTPPVPIEISSAQAHVDLGLITALKLGTQWMPSRWAEDGDKTVGFDVAVRLANAQRQPEVMQLDVVQDDSNAERIRGLVRVCGIDIHLPIAEFALLAMYAIVKQQAKNCPGGEAFKVTELPASFWDELTVNFKYKRKHFSKFSQNKFTSNRSTLESTLKSHIGDAAKHYDIAPFGEKIEGGNRPYHLITAANLIDFVGDGWDSDWWRLLKKHIKTTDGQTASNPAWLISTQPTA